MSGSGPLDPPVSWGRVADLRRELVRLGAKDGPQAAARAKVIRQALAAHGIPEQAPDGGIVPYYTSPDGMIVVYHARWENVLAAGLVVPAEVALVHADPPYGIKLDTKARSNARTSLPGGGRTRSPSFAPIVGDDKPFDPDAALALDRPLVVWGGHLCVPALPRSPSWIFWDKREGMAEIDNGDGEMAWTNLGGPIRRFPYMWSGVLRATNGGRPGSGRHLHPTEKPEALSAYVYARAKLKPNDLVFVPYMGSGPDLAACVARGRRCITARWRRNTVASRSARAFTRLPWSRAWVRSSEVRYERLRQGASSGERTGSMRERDALRSAYRFVEKNYKDVAGDNYYVEVALEQDGERKKSWSFGVHPDGHKDERGYVGYVHANGQVEGLY